MITAADARAREARFQEHLTRSKPYFAAVRAAGDLPWFCEGHDRREVVIEALGLPADIAELDLQRALFMKRYQESN